LIVGGFDGFFEVVSYLAVVAFARLQRQSLRFRLEDDGAIAKNDKSVYFADLFSVFRSR